MRRWRIVVGLVIGATVAGACGGGDEPASDSEQPATEEPADEPATDDTTSEPAAGPAKTDEPSVAGPLVSDDGRLTILNPPAGADITIEPGESFIEDPLFTSVAVYDLAPDGASFDPPLEVEFVLGDTSEPTAVFHQTAAGVDGIDSSRSDGIVSFQLTSFSRAEITRLSSSVTLSLEAPAQVDEGSRFFVTWTLSEGDGATLASGESRSFGVAEDGFSTSGFVSRIDGDEYSCNGAPGGLISYIGPLSLFVDPISEDFITLARIRAHIESDFIERRVETECITKRTAIPPSDTNTYVRATGEQVEPTLTPDDLGASFTAGSDGLTVSANVPDGSMALLILVAESDSGYRQFEISNEGGVRAFSETGIFDATPDSGPRAQDGPNLDIDGIAWDPAGDVPTIELPGGTTPDGDPVDVFVGEFRDLTIFVVDEDDITNTFFWNVSDIAEGLDTP